MQVAAQLASRGAQSELAADLRCEYAAIRKRNVLRQRKVELLSLDAARGNKLQLDWTGFTPPTPARLGVTATRFSINELAPYIDWTPFFMTWELAGKYPAILDDDKVGESARSLFADAEEMLAGLAQREALKIRAVTGIWPCRREGDDDIRLFADEARSQTVAIVHHLRQQRLLPEGKPNLCLADFVSPERDYLGGFAVTAGLGIDEALSAYQDDDYSSILIKALADRLAEAAAERLHERVRRELWGYATAERLDNTELIAERYQGIRPAPGYPACPDHTEKGKLFELLDAQEATGIELTESYAMHPAASVSGWYFGHPESRYFGVGKIDDDQVRDYAQRKGFSVEDARRWLSPNLSRGA